MIVAERKPLETLAEWLTPYSRVALVGCKGCVTVCHAGGLKEVEILAAQLTLHARERGRMLEVGEWMMERQCDPEYIEEKRESLAPYEAILSLACGAGVQLLAERFPTLPVLPGLDTRFMGVAAKPGEFSERCQACGACKLHLTAGICPVSRCSKSLLNGPCGGSWKGRCEVDESIPCAWQLIVDRLKAQGRLGEFERVLPANDWRTSRDGGPRRIVREDLA